MTALLGMKYEISVANGIATLGPQATRLLATLDGVFQDWGQRAGAAAMTLPPVLGVADLAAFKVFENFPHLTWVAATLKPARAASYGADGELAPDVLEPVRLGLPAAVCYGVYLRFKDQTISETTVVTATGTCFRKESRQEDGLRRLNTFRMREIVALGSSDHVHGHLSRLGALLSRFAGELDIPVAREAGHDSFYRLDGPQARWQHLEPVKYEYRFGDLALASSNEHRKFFGEACRIVGEKSGSVVSTGCFGMGLERWIHSLVHRYDGEWDEIFRMVEQASVATVAEEFGQIGGAKHDTARSLGP